MFKIRMCETENSPVRNSSQTGCRQASSAGLTRPSSERPSVPNPGKNRSSTSVEPSRLQLILQRLRGDFYQVPPASEEIATSVLADLNDPEESSPALPH
jgi:hypothetical protein